MPYYVSRFVLMPFNTLKIKGFEAVYFHASFTGASGRIIFICPSESDSDYNRTTKLVTFCEGRFLTYIRIFLTGDANS